jgi:hypothetical protein
MRGVAAEAACRGRDTAIRVRHDACRGRDTAIRVRHDLQGEERGHRSTTTGQGPNQGQRLVVGREKKKKRKSSSSTKWKGKP